MSDTLTINKRKYRIIQEMEIGTMIELTDLIVEIEEEKNDLPLLTRFARDARKLKKFVCLVLEPVDEVDADYDEWEDLKHITIPQILEVVRNFFSPAGPMKLMDILENA